MNIKALIGGRIAAVVVAAVAVPLAILPSGTKQAPSRMVMAPAPRAFIAPPPGEEPNKSPLPPDPMPADPGNPNMKCGRDMTSVLQHFLSHLPAGVTVVFPHDACYTVDDGIVLQNLSNINIEGNGVTFNQWPPAPKCDNIGCDTPIPVLFLAADSNINIEDFNIQGAWDGTPDMSGPCMCGHGEFYEGKIGMELNGNTNITITGSTIQGTQGDGFSLGTPGAPRGGFLPGFPVNHNITLADSTLNNIGYTMSIAGVVGFTFVHSTLNNLQQIDAEVDEASTSFSSLFSTAPIFAAQDNILFADDDMSNFNVFWFTSLQGDTITGTTGHPYTPGCGFAGSRCIPSVCIHSSTCGTSYWAVQQYNVAFIGNTIDCSDKPDCQLLNVKGTQAGIFDNRFLNIGLTISHNTLLGYAKGTAGGGCAAGYGSTMSFNQVNSVTITDNVMHGFISSACPGPPTAALNAIFANNVQGLTVSGNDFTGDYAVIDSRDSSNVTECNNTYGTNGGSTDGPCHGPSPQPPSRRAQPERAPSVTSPSHPRSIP